MLCLLVLLILPVIWTAVRRPRVASAHGGMVCMSIDGEDDSDIKIAGHENSEQVDEAAYAAEELAKQRQNGNLEKAHSLGKLLVKLMMEEDVSVFCGGSAAGRVHLHCRLLLLCAAYSRLNALPGKVLPGVARGAFNETLQAQYPNFYKQVVNSGALSFYTLGLRSFDDPAEELGRTFARLTDREGDVGAERDGAHLYRSFLQTADRAVDACRLAR